MIFPRHPAFLALLLGSIGSSLADGPAVVREPFPLWPGGPPGMAAEAPGLRPTLTLYPADHGKATGAPGRRPAPAAATAGMPTTKVGRSPSG